MKRPETSRGFSLVELMVAVAVFTVIAGSAFSLVAQHEPIAQRELQLSGLNTSLRSAIGQIQSDLGNAGTGYFTSANVTSFPIGAVVDNQSPVANCSTGSPTFTYGATCFDTLNIVEADTSTLANFTALALHPAIGFSTSAGTLQATPIAGDTAAKDAAYFKVGDELLLFASSASTASSCSATGTATTKFSAVVLSAAGAVSGSNVLLTYSALPTNGQVLKGSANADPLELTAFCGASLATNSYPFATTDWVVRLDGITYKVDTTTNPADPRLVRTQRGVTSMVADQIIGFKVGAGLWNTSTSANDQFFYDPSEYTNTGTVVPFGTLGNDPYDFSLVRSLRASLIGRTPPSVKTNTFTNPFDDGPYEIEALSTVVNPRNLSMNDQ